MGRPHATRWTQVSLLHETTPSQVELPPAILVEAISVLADLLLTHLGATVAAAEGRHESEDHA
jgi:hypothetical protein